MRIRLSVHPIALVFFAFSVLFFPLPQLLLTLLALLLHECAHIIAMALCAVKRCQLEWTPFGAVADAAGYAQLSCSRRGWIAAAGILVSGGLTLVCLPLSMRFVWAYQSLKANLALFVVNCLPVLPLDGARVVLAVAAYAGCERMVEKVLLIISYGFSFALIAVFIAGAAQGVFNPTLLLLGPYLAYAARQSTIDTDMEAMRLAAYRLQNRKDGVFQAVNYVSLGEPLTADVVKIMKKTAEKHYVLLQVVNPVTGQLIDCKTEQTLTAQLFDTKTQENHVRGQ
ncbi:MAG: hypothetical protein E7319_02930 [Clostridiales bacterium]|nr:hypothetical protein [Clostridiales bacterium]